MRKDYEKVIAEYLNSRKFTVLWSGGKDSTATLLWVLNHVHHSRFNVVYTEITGNTHPDVNKYVYQLSKQLGISNRLVVAKRNDIDFFSCMEKFGIPLPGHYRWCLHYFKVEVWKKVVNTVVVIGVKHDDSRIRKAKRRDSIFQVFRVTNTVTVAPIWFWSKNDVIRYLQHHGIPENPCYRKYLHSGNCMFCPYHREPAIVRTLSDPEWREKIISALSKVNPKGRISKQIWKKWMRLAHQTNIFDYINQNPPGNN